MFKFSAAFLNGFLEGLNPMFSFAYLLYAVGHLLSLLMNRFVSLGGVLYPAYNTLMIWSMFIQNKFKFSGPWVPAEKSHMLEHSDKAQ